MRLHIYFLSSFKIGNSWDFNIYFRYYLLSSTIGHFSLFPLLFTPKETVSKLTLHLLHWGLSAHTLSQCHGGQRTKLLCWWERVYLSGTAFVSRIVQLKGGYIYYLVGSRHDQLLPPPLLTYALL